jgi:2'-5' RNA ligase
VSDSVRCFLAVRVPPDRAGALRDAQARLRAVAGDWKWVDADSFHITLKFLGEVERAAIPGLWASVSEALRGSQCFVMQFCGLGVFPNPRAPRVAWAGIDGGAVELRELAARVEEACVARGFERERRPFRAHLTLGRARRQARDTGLAAALADFTEAQLGEAMVDRVLLMKSTLTPRGAIYDVMEEHLLDEGEAQ